MTSLRSVSFLTVLLLIGCSLLGESRSMFAPELQEGDTGSMSSFLCGPVNVETAPTGFPFPLALVKPMVVQDPGDRRLLLGYSITNGGGEDVINHAVRVNFYDWKGSQVGFQTLVSGDTIPAGTIRAFSMVLPEEVGSQTSVLITPLKVRLPRLTWSADHQQWMPVFEGGDVTAQQCAPPCNASTFCAQERDACIGICGQGGVKEFSCSISCTGCSSKCTCFGKN
jgi:hypothetical protein